MQDTILDLIKSLTAINSPSGHTEKAIQYVKDYAKELGFKTYQTTKGGLFIEVEGDNQERQRCITAHVDTLGAMVKEIKEDGRLALDIIGSFNYNAVEGDYVEIETATGEMYTGTICLHETSVHVYRDNDKIPRDQAHMEVRIDEKVRSAEETRDLGIEVGDFVSFDPKTVVTQSGFIKSRHLDDKASVAMIMAFLKEIRSESITLPHQTYFYISNNEEIGYGANSNISDQIEEFIAFDMGALGDGQNSDEYTVSICAKDSSGPYHKKLKEQLIQLCKLNKIPYKVDIYPYYVSDASAALKAGADIKHGLFGAGIESSHALERTHVDSLNATMQLLKVYCLSKMDDA
ncbi:M42 family metallopeptidase [Staphylococcus massiliensis]|uniref:Peptidase n=1 Tax=Staphylococcus massiliensis S46 TaxID=1229783 RepID=K9AIH0_9STAP|nr:M42 family metallopeptidase [Staphylococcus massiliensis]EKU47089.1 peptidase [Staphylococcus massiliensis S46]MCG3398619.1 M42 family metallopeptidase [Staphylococcus massiliensis]MCG3401182.1 M42 family metallopeptidase [Staphylococcus massiliensis]MCG3412320.1 M42 family metallopeptidase [Staphylococcus massiliensis]PNZ98525.1 aminopeptidase [Staphylococcus massiliensis CCUG 55927]